MAWFTAKEWKNRLVEFAGRRSLKNVSTNETTVYDVTRNEGQVSQEGDAFSATTMNNLEQRISEGFSAAEEANSQLSSELHQNIFEDLGVFYDTGSLDATKFYKGLYQSNGKHYVFFQLPSVFSVQILFLNTEAEAEIDSIAFRISPGGNFSGIAWTWLKYSSKTPSA